MEEGAWTSARARAWLDALGRRGTMLGLERVETVAARLGYPEHSYPSVLIAGTNGKGSVAAILDTVLAGAGYRVGRYTSPHLMDWPERITVAGHPIPETDLAISLQTVEEAAGHIEITAFEAITLAAFWHFRRSRVHMAVVEVGLGGRLDATRICRAAVTAVTTVDLDHTAELGADLQRIAREKGAISRAGVPHVLGPGTAPVRTTLEVQARENRTESFRSESWVGLHTRQDPGWGSSGSAEWLGTAAAEAERHGEPRGFDWRLPLGGAHMLDNLTTSLACVNALRRSGFRIPTDSAVSGLESVRWPGRLQWIPGPPGRPDLLLDVGHNPAAASAVAAALDRGSHGRPRSLVVALAQDKDLAGFLAPLLHGVGLLVATGWRGSRARPPQEVAEGARKEARRSGRSIPIEVSDDPVEAVARAVAHTDPRGLVVATGSHMLIGPILESLRTDTGRDRLWNRSGAGESGMGRWRASTP